MYLIKPKLEQEFLVPERPVPPPKRLVRQGGKWEGRILAGCVILGFIGVPLMACLMR